jgi:outer membrane cobalamin receptor
MRPRQLIGLLLAALPFAGGAQESGAPQPDPELEELVILGVRPGALERIPTAATDSLATADREGENQTLPELLTGAPGVWVRRLGGRADDAEISIRGSAANQVLLTLDGVPINSLVTGVGDAAGVCLPLIERIDITRGAGAAQAGSGAVAGVVDLHPHARSAGTSARASGGAFDTYEGSLRHANQWGDLGFQLGYCGLTTQGDFEFARPTQEVNGIPITFDPDEATRENNDRERHGAHVGLQHPLFGGELRFTDLFEFEKGGAPGFDSGNGVDAGQALNARKRDWSQLAILAWEGPLGGALGDQLELRAHHRFESLGFRDPTPALGPPSDLTTRAHTFGGQARDAWELEVGGARQTLAVFGDGAHERLSSRSSLDETRGRGGAGAEAVLRGFDERILLSAALRLDGAEGFTSEWLPSVGLSITPLPWLRLRTNWGRAYRTPTLVELFLPNQRFTRGNPLLVPEDAFNFDVGLELELEALGPLRDVRFRGSWFRREIDEAIVWVQINPTTVAPINTGDATADGYELSLDLGLTDWIRASASHTRLDSRRDATRKRLPGQPRNETHARLELGPKERLKLVGELARTGTLLVNEGGGRKLPSRTVWNASASVNLARLPGIEALPHTEAFWVFFEINNIGDEAVRDSLSFPQPGRNASAGFEGRW